MSTDGNRIIEDSEGRVIPDHEIAEYLINADEAMIIEPPYEFETHIAVIIEDQDGNEELIYISDEEIFDEYIEDETVVWLAISNELNDLCT